MKCVFCSNCGLRLAVIRKALPKYGRIIDLIEPHKCLDKPVEFDLTPVEVPTFTNVVEEGKNKFVQKLNELEPLPLLPPIPGIEGTGDKRNPEHVKSEGSSSAPRTLLDNVKAMHNTTPVHDIESEPNG